jgi:hypothetical protein
MAKIHRMEALRIQLDKLKVECCITKNESLRPLIDKLESELDYFNFGIKKIKK